MVDNHLRKTIENYGNEDGNFKKTVVEGDRIDLLAHRYLGDACLWWIICDYNDIFFPLEFTPGTDLRIPSVEHVQMRLLD